MCRNDIGRCVSNWWLFVKVFKYIIFIHRHQKELKIFQFFFQIQSGILIPLIKNFTADVWGFFLLFFFLHLWVHAKSHNKLACISGMTILYNYNYFLTLTTYFWTCHLGSLYSEWKAAATSRGNSSHLF